MLLASSPPPVPIPVPRSAAPSLRVSALRHPPASRAQLEGPQRYIPASKEMSHAGYPWLERAAVEPSAESAVAAASPKDRAVTFAVTTWVGRLNPGTSRGEAGPHRRILSVRRPSSDGLGGHWAQRSRAPCQDGSVPDGSCPVGRCLSRIYSVGHLIAGDVILLGGLSKRRFTEKHGGFEQMGSRAHGTCCVASTSCHGLPSDPGQCVRWAGSGQPRAQRPGPSADQWRVPGPKKGPAPHTAQGTARAARDSAETTPWPPSRTRRQQGPCRIPGVEGLCDRDCRRIGERVPGSAVPTRASRGARKSLPASASSVQGCGPVTLPAPPCAALTVTRAVGLDFGTTCVPPPPPFR